MCSYIFSKENLYILFRNLLRTHLDQIHVFRPEHEPNGPLPEDIHLFTPYLLRRNVIRLCTYLQMFVDLQPGPKFCHISIIDL